MRDEVDTQPGKPEDERLRAQDLLYSRLVTLIQVIDDSAAIAYPRALHRRHLTRLLVFLMGLAGSATSSDLVLATGYEKAQVSRGLKGLAEAGLLDRPEVRGLIRLNEAGIELFEQIMVVARERDAHLRQGLAKKDIQNFLSMTGRLIERMSRLVVADDGSGAANDDPPEPVCERHLTSISAPTVHDLILPALRSLMVYIRRSGTSLFRREVGLTNLEWRVLSLIAENVPISLSVLIPLAARDKSQVARAVKQLHVMGLVRRHDEGRVNLAIELSPAGAAAHEKILAIGERHDRLVFADFPADQQQLYMDVLDRITRNAVTLLAAEEANIARQGTDAGPGQLAISGGVTCADEGEQDRLRSENDSLRQQLSNALEELTLARKYMPG